MTQDELAAFKKKLAESETLRREFARFAAEKIGLDPDALDDSELEEVAGGFGLPLPKHEASAVKDRDNLNESGIPTSSVSSDFAAADSTSLLSEFMKLNVQDG